jgi:two-component system, LytTR family, response regulator
MDSFRFRRLAARPPSGPALWAGAHLLLLLGYAVVFAATLNEGAAASLLAAAVNVAPLALLTAATHAALRAYVMPLGVWAQAVAHATLAPVFSASWYALILVGHAVIAGASGRGWSLGGFGAAALIWQLFQGVVLYATVAAACYAIRGGRQAAPVAIVAAPPLERYLTRAGDDIVPVLVRDIVSITGAQDYAEVTTLTGRHLVRMSLGELERRLDATRFLRVHRSAIVNFDHLARAESAGGGRMLAHMSNGEVIAASRAGAQLLRAFVV